MSGFTTWPSTTRRRLIMYGPNEIEEKKTNAILKFPGYFWGPIRWMIDSLNPLPGVLVLALAGKEVPDTQPAVARWSARSNTAKTCRQASPESRFASTAPMFEVCRVRYRTEPRARDS